MNFEKIEVFKKNSGRIVSIHFFKKIKMMPLTAIKHKFVEKVDKDEYLILIDPDFDTDKFLEDQKQIHRKNCTKGARLSPWSYWNFEYVKNIGTINRETGN